MTITNLQLSYPAFKLQQIIDPDETNINNGEIVVKINAIVDLVNKITDSVISGGSGADQISLTPIAPFASNKLQAFLSEVLTHLSSTTSGSSGAKFIGSTAIAGVTGTTVQDQLTSLKTLLDAVKKSVETDASALVTHKASADHDGRYYTKTQVDTSLGKKADVASVFSKTDLTNVGALDVRYYTETEINGKVSEINVSIDGVGKRIDGVDTEITNLKGRASLLEGRATSLEADKTPLIGDHKGTWQGFSPSAFDSGSLSKKIDGHIANVSNPHSVTAAQIGAFTKVELQNGALDTRYALKTELPTDIPQIKLDLSSTTKLINDHISSKVNPHGVTAAQVGAYAKLEADNIFAKKTELPTTEIPQIKTDLTATTKLITDHSANRTNPHGVTAAQIGAYTKAEIEATFAKKADVPTDVAQIKSDLATTKDTVNQHVANKLNPHGVTAAQVGSYTKLEVDNTFAKKADIPTDVTQIKADLASTTKLITDHSANKANPHSTTPAQIGAYTKVEVDNTFAKKTEVPTDVPQIKADLAGTTSLVNNHISNKTNPHSVTAVQVGAYAKLEADNVFAKKVDAQMYKITMDDGTRKFIERTNTLALDQIPPGAYYLNGNSVAGTPIPSDSSFYTLDITNGGGLRQYKMVKNFSNEIWYGTHHSAGQWQGWYKNVTDKPLDWKNLTMQNGWVSHTTYPCQYAVIGNEVVFRGRMYSGTLGSTANNYAPAFTMPSGAASSSVGAALLTGYSSLITAKIYFFTSGVVSVVNMSTPDVTGQIDLAGLRLIIS